MESEVEKSKKEYGSDSVFDESVNESRESSRWSWNSRSSSDFPSPPQLVWLIDKPSSLSKNDVSDVKYKPLLNSKSVVDGDQSKLDKKASNASELKMMMERFSKLLLGEDMSGSGKGVCTALAISNAITNLYATVFGQLWRLEPLPSEKKSMWQREMDWLLCVSDYIVEMIPSWQKLPGGNRVEVMSSRPRSDLVINLPALRKLDNMLIEILDAFTNSEFWYVDQGIGAPGAVQSVSFRKAMQRQEEKWWLPVPRVPPESLSESMRKRLSQKLECTSQILKAASAINSSVLAEMDVPKSYLDTLPKSAKACLGEIMYRCITSEHFSPNYLLDCLDLASEHAAVEMANRVESAIYVWIRRLRPKHPNLSSVKSSWEIVRNHMVHGDKQELFIVRAENLLLSLKQRFPGLTQTTLDASKIHCNKDVGKSILESYSRVLEGLAYSIMARIEDLIYVDDLNKETDKLSSAKLISTQNTPISFPMPASAPPYETANTRGKSDKSASRGLGPKRVVVNYIGGNEEAKDSGFIPKGPGPSASH